MSTAIDEEQELYINTEEQDDNQNQPDSSPISHVGVTESLLNAQQMFQTILDDLLTSSLDDPDREQTLKNFGKYIKRSCITAYPAVFKNIFSPPPTKESKYIEKNKSKLTNIELHFKSSR